MSFMSSLPPSWVERYLRVWGGIYLLLVLLLTLAAMYTLAVSVWRGPWRDMWEAMPFIEEAVEGRASWLDYWEQYGFSHRPLISRWLWVADVRWFSASNALLLAVSFLMQLMIWFCVRAVLQRDNTFTPYQRGIVLTGVFFCLLNITQVFNFLHTFDVQWFLVAGFVVLSLERILANEEKNPGWLVVSWCCVMIASLNNFSALVMWPVEILLLVALRFPVKHTVIFSGVNPVVFFPVFLSAGTWWQLVIGGNHAIVRVAMGPGFAIGLLVVFPLWYLSNPLSFQLATEGPLSAPWPVSWMAPLLAAVLLMPVYCGVGFRVCYREKNILPLRGLDYLSCCTATVLA
jgi:hypothetical protein